MLKIGRLITLSFLNEGGDARTWEGSPGVFYGESLLQTHTKKN